MYSTNWFLMKSNFCYVSGNPQHPYSHIHNDAHMTLLLIELSMFFYKDENMLTQV